MNEQWRIKRKSSKSFWFACKVFQQFLYPPSKNGGRFIFQNVCNTSIEALKIPWNVCILDQYQTLNNLKMSVCPSKEKISLIAKIKISASNSTTTLQDGTCRSRYNVTEATSPLLKAGKYELCLLVTNFSNKYLHILFYYMGGGYKRSGYSFIFYCSLCILVVYFLQFFLNDFNNNTHTCFFFALDI